MRRRSLSKVGATAPTHIELLRLVDAASTVADHSSLRPWRLIELRGDARDRLGEAFAEAAEEQQATGHRTGSTEGREKFIAKAKRAPLLIAIVVSQRPSEKVAPWEQEAVAAGVAHNLTVLLDEAGWGVMWRSGHLTRTEPVRRMHELAPGEQLLGWLYVGDAPRGLRELRHKRPNPADFLTEL